MHFPRPQSDNHIGVSQDYDDDSAAVSSITRFPVGSVSASGRLNPSTLRLPEMTAADSTSSSQEPDVNTGPNAEDHPFVEAAATSDPISSQFDIDQALEADESILGQLVQQGVIPLASDKATEDKSCLRTSHKTQGGEAFKDLDRKIREMASETGPVTAPKKNAAAGSHLIEAWNYAATTGPHGRDVELANDPAATAEERQNPLHVRVSSTSNATIHADSGMPGAFAEGGAGLPPILERAVRRNNDAQADSNQPVHSTAVPHAVPVADDLEVAEEVVVQGSQKANSAPKEYVRCAIIWALWIILLVVVVVLPLTLTKESLTKADENEQGSESTGGAPTMTFIIDLPSYTKDAIMSDTQSPQAKAYTWLLEDPYLDHYTKDRQQQRFAMATLFHATNGYNWTASKNWLNYEKSECLWWNLAKLPPLSADICSGGDKLDALALVDNGMEGAVPREIGMLSTLKALVLGVQGNLVGTIPMEVWKLPQLMVLSIHRNQLTGTLPPQGLVAAHQPMIYMDLADNNFHGTVPSEIGLFRNLTHLGLSDNQYTGTLPNEMQGMVGLEYLGVHANMFTGNVGSNMFHGWSSMTDISLRGNLFSGSLATEIGTLTDLNYISTYENLFSGSLPSELGLLTRLHTLILSVNNFSGSMPSEIGSLGERPLQILDTWSNQLSGVIPEEVWHLHGLETLALDSNKFSGSIPPDCGVTLGSSMLTFELWNNMLTGSIPSSIGLWTELRKFFVDGNDALTGSVPQELWAISSLQKVSIGGNVTGLVPSILPDLTWLELLSPMMSGVVPDTVCDNPDLEHLEIRCSATLCGCDCPACNTTLEE